MAQRVEDLAWSLLWLGLDPLPGNFLYAMGMAPKNGVGGEGLCFSEMSVS